MAKTPWAWIDETGTNIAVNVRAIRPLGREDALDLAAWIVALTDPTEEEWESRLVRASGGQQ